MALAAQATSVTAVQNVLAASSSFLHTYLLASQHSPTHGSWPSSALQNSRWITPALSARTSRSSHFALLQPSAACAKAIRWLTDHAATRFFLLYVNTPLRTRYQVVHHRPNYNYFPRSTRLGIANFPLATYFRPRQIVPSKPSPASSLKSSSSSYMSCITPSSTSYAGSEAGDSVSTLRPEANGHFFELEIPRAPVPLAHTPPATLLISALPAILAGGRLVEVDSDAFEWNAHSFLTLTLSDIRSLALRQQAHNLLVQEIRTTLALHDLWPRFDANEPVRDERFEPSAGRGQGTGYVVSFDEDVEVESVAEILKPLLGERLVMGSHPKETEAKSKVPFGGVHLVGPCS